jgi:hypothetical protein
MSVVNDDYVSNPGAPAHPPKAQRPVLLGVKHQDWRSGETARGLGRKLAERGEIAYWVVSPEKRLPAGQGVNQRAQARRRTRLRSAKLLDANYRFLCEGRICDQSRDGLRLALASDVALPSRLAIHLDETSEVRDVEVAWRCGSTIGVRLHAAAPADALRPCDRLALRERYYAIPG